MEGVRGRSPRRIVGPSLQPKDRSAGVSADGAELAQRVGMAEFYKLFIINKL